MDEWKDGRMDGWMEWMDGWMDGMDGWKDGRMEGWRNKLKWKEGKTKKNERK